MKNKYLWKIDPEEMTCGTYLRHVINGKIKYPFFKQEKLHDVISPSETILTERLFLSQLFQELVFTSEVVAELISEK